MRLLAHRQYVGNMICRAVLGADQDASDLVRIRAFHRDRCGT